MQYQERELVIYNEDTEEWKEEHMRYGRLKGGLRTQVSLSIGFVMIGGKLIDWNGCRIIMQKSTESKQGH